MATMIFQMPMCCMKHIAPDKFTHMHMHIHIHIIGLEIIDKKRLHVSDHTKYKPITSSVIGSCRQKMAQYSLFTTYLKVLTAIQVYLSQVNQSNKRSNMLGQKNTACELMHFNLFF